MPDRERVLKGLEFHLKELSVGKTCYECPYIGDNPCEIQLIAQALELLKGQEPVKPIDETCWDYTYGRCGHCRAPLPALEGLHSKFCWMCGRAVKWDV